MQCHATIYQSYISEKPFIFILTEKGEFATILNINFFVKSSLMHAGKSEAIEDAVLDTVSEYDTLISYHYNLSFEELKLLAEIYLTK